MNATATPDTAIPTDKHVTPEDIIREATKDRRHPLRGKALVDLARKLGLDWADTGTGHAPGSAFRSSRKGEQNILHLVMDTGSIVRVEVDEGGYVFKPAPRPTKKERSRAKKQTRLKAEAAMTRERAKRAVRLKAEAATARA